MSHPEFSIFENSGFFIGKAQSNYCLLIGYVLFFLTKKEPKKSRLDFFWLKMDFASHSQPEPLLCRSLIALFANAQSHFLNSKTNNASHL
jgi:hypothetical protein